MTKEEVLREIGRLIEDYEWKITRQALIIDQLRRELRKERKKGE